MPRWYCHACNQYSVSATILHIGGIDKKTGKERITHCCPICQSYYIEKLVTDSRED